MEEKKKHALFGKMFGRSGHESEEKNKQETEDITETQEEHSVSFMPESAVKRDVEKETFETDAEINRIVDKMSNSVDNTAEDEEHDVEKKRTNISDETFESFMTEMIAAIGKKEEKHSDEQIDDALSDIFDNMATEEAHRNEDDTDKLISQLLGSVESTEEKSEKYAYETLEEAVRKNREEAEVDGKTVEKTVEDIVKETVNETAAEEAEETVKDFVEETVNETAAETAEETAEEIVEETVNETAAETAEKTVENIVKEMMNGTSAETAEETAEETVDETVNETAAETAEETVGDIVEKTVDEAFGPAAEKTVEESVEEIPERITEFIEENYADKKVSGESTENDKENTVNDKNEEGNVFDALFGDEDTDEEEIPPLDFSNVMTENAADGSEDLAADAENGIAGEQLGVEDVILMEALGYDGTETAVRTKGDTTEHGHGTSSHMSKVPVSEMEGAFAYDGHEYKSHTQNEEISGAYNREKLLIKIRFIGTAVMALLLMIWDCFGSQFGGAFDHELYPTVNVLIALQLLLIAAVFSYKQIFSGIKGIFRAHPTVHSITGVVVAMTVVYDILLAIIASVNFKLYNFPAAVCLLMTVVHDYLVVEQEARAFGKLSRWEGVCTLERVDGTVLAEELGESTIGNESGNVGRAYRLRRGSFAENYFHRTNRRDPMTKAINYIIAPVIALALVVFIVSLAAKRPLVDSLNVYIVLIQFGLPSFMAVATVFPFFTLTGKKLDGSGVILNETDTLDYASVDTFVFDEKDVFDDNALTVNRLTMCGNGEAGDIYDVLAGTATILGKLGGTIANALKDATPDVGDTEKAELLQIAENGIVGSYAGKGYAIGTDEFLSGYGISVSRYFDEEFLSSTPGGAVLHIAVDGKEALKLYLSYRVSESFGEMAHELSERKVRMVLRCSDPCVNDVLITNLVGELSSPITILKKTVDEADRAGSAEENGESDTFEAGLLADSRDWMSVMKAADACGAYKKWARFNILLMGGVMALGIMLAAFLGALGAVIGMSSMYVVLFQILAILPTAVISKLWLE
ncbi:MAG: hypothetical protein MJ102_05000 [Clostridia bacterium]|nr:hypothetical protein [Clostridia bacterium]